MTGTPSSARAVRRALLCLSTVLATGLAAPAFAQSAPAPEQRRNSDEVGVDVVTGTFNPVILEGDVGNASEGIKLYRYWGQAGFKDNWSGELRITGSAGSFTATITFGTTSLKFTQSGSAWINQNGDGSTLTSEAQLQGTTYTLKQKDGKTVYYQNVSILSGTGYANEAHIVQAPSSECQESNSRDCALPTKITEPDGSEFKLDWHVPSQCQDSSTLGSQYVSENGTITCFTAYRLTDVRSKSSYAMKMKYESDGWAAGSAAPPASWSKRSGAKFYDLGQVYCNPEALDCDAVASVNAVTYSNPNATTLNITDERNGTWVLTSDANGRLTGIRRPGATADNITVTYVNGRVSQVVDDGETRTYTWGTSGTNTTLTTTTSGGETYHWTANPTTLAIMQAAEGCIGGTCGTMYLSNVYGRPDRITRPEGDYTNFTYDPRGNVTEVRVVAKPGSAEPDIVQTANYDLTCANLATCNKPNYTIDPKGNRTDYSYGPVHGQVTRVQLPAPVTGGPRPEVNYSYSALYPQVMSETGGLGYTDTPEYKVTQITTCATAATCAGTANETKVTMAYDTPNLQVTSVTVASGDGAISSTTAYSYDWADNLKTIDGPLPGNADTTTLFYDSVNRTTGVIGPDPDGSASESRQRPAERYTYDAESRITRKERGFTSEATDAALAAMTVADFSDITYDARGNVVRTEFKSGTTTHAVTQYSYDVDNRLTCTAVRMNPAVFAALPQDACTASTLNAQLGPDRISKNFYDAAGRITKVQTALGQDEQADEVTVSYSPNGKTATVRDAEGNLTTYEYDGFDRLKKTRLPLPTAGANASSATDYEELTYDANSNVTQRRLRDGATITFALDNLNRITALTPSGESPINFTHDLAGRTTQIARPNQNSGVTMSYDALGRLLSEGQPFGSAAYQYDVAGRLTRITWGDAFYVVYDYDTAGNVTAIRENGATSGIGVLATYSYDNLGRRTGIARGNGTSTSYDFGGKPRLEALEHDLSGPLHDVTIGSMIYNPAGQITSQVRDNPAYAWAGHYNVNRDYTVNGLNQQTAAGATALDYDARGNLVTSGTSTYGYDKLGRMISAPGVNLGYDAAGRLSKFVGSTGAVRFSYAGSALIQETYDPGGPIIRRYVPGPGMDEPVVWYEGSGTADRRWLHADERGSVIAISDGAGAMLAINRYDEYGIPEAGGAGRFRYTGQVWLGELGMYYYKARMYSPSLGRFMQTDPIGYGDGMNWYNYVGSDPVNFKDPTGTTTVCRLVDGGWRIWFYDYNHDGFPQPNEMVGKTMDQIAECSGDGTIPGILNLDFDINDIVVIAKKVICKLPPIAGGGGADAYAGVGGSVSGAGSFNPRNGQISLAFDTGVGVGLGGGGRIAVGKFVGIGNGSSESLPIAGGGVNINGTAVAGPAGITGSYQLIGSNRGDYGIAATGGAELSANANLSGHGQFNLPPIYDLGCK